MEHPTMSSPAKVTASGFPPTVLIVDDAETAATILATALRIEGFRALVALSGEDALTRCHTDSVDAVVLDLYMPALSGFLVLKALRARFPQLPIVTITGWYLEEAHEQECRALGVSDHLIKPIDAAILVEVLRRVIQPTGEPRLDSSPSPAVDCGRPGYDLVLASATTCAEDDGVELLSAQNDFIRARLPALLSKVQRMFPRTPGDDVLEGIHDALLEFLAKLRRGLWPIVSFDARLHQAAWRNVRDRVQASQRRRAREAAYAAENAQILWPDEELPERLPHPIGHLEGLVGPDEGDALRLWMEGAPEAAIAAALRVDDLPLNDRVREVKRFKDRVKKRARRACLRSTPDGPHPAPKDRG